MCVCVCVCVSDFVAVYVCIHVFCNSRACAAAGRAATWYMYMYVFYKYSSMIHVYALMCNCYVHVHVRVCTVGWLLQRSINSTDSDACDSDNINCIHSESTGSGRIVMFCWRKWYMNVCKLAITFCEYKSNDYMKGVVMTL